MRPHLNRPVWACLWLAAALPGGLLTAHAEEAGKSPPSAEPAAKGAPTVVTWEVDNLSSIAGHKVEIAGAPKVIETDRGKAVAFDGQADALFLDANPLKGLAAYTVEALFRPDADGSFEQRFFHVQETAGPSRVLLELRLPGPAPWYADTFIPSGKAQRALNDPKQLHPAGQWHTLALVCDGQQMIQYVNGVRELGARIPVAPLGEARTSIGVRYTRVSWFKGAVRLIRITPRALSPEELLKPDR